VGTVHRISMRHHEKLSRDWSNHCADMAIFWFVKLGPSASSKGAHPQFLANVRCGQMAGWTKMPLGTEADLGQGHILLHGDRAPLRKGHSSPLLFWDHVYCGHGHPSQLPLSSCSKWRLSATLNFNKRPGRGLTVIAAWPWPWLWIGSKSHQHSQHIWD